MAAGSRHEWYYDSSTDIIPETPEDNPGWEYAPEYVELNYWDPRYQEISAAFLNGWTHPNKQAHVLKIYHVIESAFHQWPHGQRFYRYMGFRLEHAKCGGMFGQGLYSSDSSSKADHYAKNFPYMSSLWEPPGTRAILVCRVICDKPQRLVGPEYQRKEPDPGFNCVEALTVKEGGTVNFPETIVYREDAIAPVAVVIYSKFNGGPMNLP